MAEDGGNISEEQRASDGGNTSSPPRTFIRLNDLSGEGERGGEEVHRDGERRESTGDPGAEETGSAGGADEVLPYPSLAPVVFFYMKQSTRPRSWCLKMVCNPYPFILQALASV